MEARTEATTATRVPPLGGAGWRRNRTNERRGASGAEDGTRSTNDVLLSEVEEVLEEKDVLEQMFSPASSSRSCTRYDHERRRGVNKRGGMHKARWENRRADFPGGRTNSAHMEDQDADEDEREDFAPMEDENHESEGKSRRARSGNTIPPSNDSVEIRHYLEDVLDALEGLIEQLQRQANQCDLLFEEHYAYTDREQSNVLYTLTLITTLTAPMVTASGYYGINFVFWGGAGAENGKPLEVSFTAAWGLWFFWGLVAALTLLIFMWFMWRQGTTTKTAKRSALLCCWGRCGLSNQKTRDAQERRRRWMRAGAPSQRQDHRPGSTMTTSMTHAASQRSAGKGRFSPFGTISRRAGPVPGRK